MLGVIANLDYNSLIYIWFNNRIYILGEKRNFRRKLGEYIRNVIKGIINNKLVVLHNF